MIEKMGMFDPSTEREIQEMKDDEQDLSEGGCQMMGAGGIILLFSVIWLHAVSDALVHTPASEALSQQKTCAVILIVVAALLAIGGLLIAIRKS